MTNQKTIPKKRIDQLHQNIDSWKDQRIAFELPHTLTNPSDFKNNHSHMSILFSEKSKKNISPLIIGYNYCKVGKDGSIHAEIDILDKARRAPHIGRTKYSLIVMRTNIMNSRPCKHCIEHLANTYSIRIKYVYYTMDKSFIRESTKDLINICVSSITPHVSKYNRRKNTTVRPTTIKY
jgi:hypothetical protein